MSVVKIFHCMKKVFRIVTEFGRTPSARKDEEGKLSGKALRNILKPLIRQCVEADVILVVDLDGTAGYGTSFLEEVFGGLIRNEGFSLSDLKQHITFKTEEDPELEDEIWKYVNDAEDERSK